MSRWFSRCWRCSPRSACAFTIWRRSSSAWARKSVLLAALGIVDLTLSASLIVIVILSGYINFVSRIDIEAHADWPRWMADVDFGELKLKLMASIVAISAIKLLEAFMDVGHESDRDLGWQTGVLATFVVSALLLALADRIGHRQGGAR